MERLKNVLPSAAEVDDDIAAYVLSFLADCEAEEVDDAELVEFVGAATGAELDVGLAGALRGLADRAESPAALQQSDDAATAQQQELVSTLCEWFPHVDRSRVKAILAESHGAPDVAAERLSQIPAPKQSTQGLLSREKGDDGGWRDAIVTRYELQDADRGHANPLMPGKHKNDGYKRGKGSMKKAPNPPKKPVKAPRNDPELAATFVSIKIVTKGKRGPSPFK